MNLLPHPLLLSESRDYKDGFSFVMDIKSPQHTLDEKISVPVKFVLKSKFIDRMHN